MVKLEFSELKNYYQDYQGWNCPREVNNELRPRRTINQILKQLESPINSSIVEIDMTGILKDEMSGISEVFKKKASIKCVDLNILG